MNRSDERLTLETSAFELFTVASLRYQLSCFVKLPRSTLPPTQHHNFFSNLPPLFVSQFSSADVNNILKLLNIV